MPRKRWAVIAAVAAGAVTTRGWWRPRRSPLRPGSWRTRISTHDTFDHDHLDSLGYDWSRVADPGVAPRHPFRIYTPTTTEDLVAVVTEAKALGEPLRIRGKGHSSNDLVLADGGSVVLTDRLDRVIAIDEEAMTVTVQAGAITAKLDDLLAARGLGLPVVGDHDEITVGGFASVGGISHASHRFGMFVDQVTELEYVTWDGEVVHCSPTERPDHFSRVLAGTGRHGIIATMTLRVIRIDKYGTVLEHDQSHYRDLESFLTATSALIHDPGDALYERGLWLDFWMGGRKLSIGQFSLYKATAQSPAAFLRDRIGHGWLHRLGYLGGRLPAAVDEQVKHVGFAGVLYGPRFATIKNIEFFTDKIIDSTVGAPSRMLTLLAPVDRYATLLAAAHRLVSEYQERLTCFAYVAFYVKAVTSPYLGRSSGDDHFFELIMYLGVDPERFDERALDGLVSDFDDLCIEHGAFRYLHTRTSTDTRRDKLDPNAQPAT